MKTRATFLSIYFAFFLSVLLSSCTDSLSPTISLEENTTATVTFNIRLDSAFRHESTKSKYSLDESTIVDYALYIYDTYGDNVFFWNSLSGSSSPKATLIIGKDYSVYCIANKGTYEDLPRKEDILAFRVTQDDLEAGRVVMTTSSSLSVRSDSSLTLTLKRSIAKISITLHSDYFDFQNGGSFASMSLRNVAQEYFPFDGSRRSSTYVNGDTQASTFQFGETITFYCLENRQGELLPDNEDSWNKIPNNIGDKASQCTYLDFSFTNSSLISGSINYKFYLGENTTTNFDVCSNTHYSLVFNLSNDIYNSSWRITPSDFGYAEGLVFANLLSYHNPDDMYVGEEFEISLNIMNHLINFLNGDLSSSEPNPEMEIAVYEGTEEVKDALKKVSLWDFSFIDKSITGMSECKAAWYWLKPVTNASIYLVDSHGTTISLLAEGVSVAYPELIMYSEERVSKSSVVLTDNTKYISPIVNEKQSEERYCYLIDKDKKNIETSCVFHRELYLDMEATCTINPTALTRSVLTASEFYSLGTSTNSSKLFRTTIIQYKEKYAPLFKVAISAVNDGTQADKNNALSKLWGIATDESSIFSCVIRLGDIEYQKRTDFAITPIDIQILDLSKWETYADGSRLFLCVHNPSNISIQATTSICALNSTDNNFKKYTNKNQNGEPISSGYNYIKYASLEHALVGPKVFSQPIIGYATRTICNNNYDSDKTFKDEADNNHEYKCYQLLNFGVNNIMSLNWYYLRTSVDCDITSLSGKDLLFGNTYKRLFEGRSDGIDYEAAVGIWSNGKRFKYLTDGTYSDMPDITKKYPGFTPAWLYDIFSSQRIDFAFDPNLNAPFLSNCDLTADDLVSCYYKTQVNGSCTYKKSSSSTTVQYADKRNYWHDKLIDLQEDVIYFTRNYFHESYKTVVALSSNIYTSIAKVTSITINLYHLQTIDKWRILNIDNPTSKTFTVKPASYTYFYTKTKEGYAPDNQDKNPDGSSRRITSLKYKGYGLNYYEGNQYTPDPFTIKFNSSFLDDDSTNYIYFDSKWK